MFLLYLLRHALFFGLIVAPTLLALGSMVSAIGARRGLTNPLTRPMSWPLFAAGIAGIGLGAQLLFFGLAALGMTPFFARAIALGLSAAGIAALTSRRVAWFCLWKGMVLGLISAFAAALLYQSLSVGVSEELARVAVGAMLAVFPAFAVTFPIPGIVTVLAPAAERTLPLLWDMEPVSFGSTIVPPDQRIRPDRTMRQRVRRKNKV